MSNNKIPDCCVARIHERLIDVFYIKGRLLDVAYLCCDDCGKGYRLSVERGKSLSAEIPGSWYYIVCHDLIYVERDDEMETGLKTFVIPTEPEYYRALEFFYDIEETEEADKLKKCIDEFVKHL